MFDISHELFINALVRDVFQAVTTPSGLDEWWTKRSAGEPKKGATFEL